jgi:hypothetical protein
LPQEQSADDHGNYGQWGILLRVRPDIQHEQGNRRQLRIHVRI